MANETATNEDGPFLTVKQFAEKHPEFNENQIRWAIFHADRNGLAAIGAIKRRNLSGEGKRAQVRLNEPKLLGWWAAA